MRTITSDSRFSALSFLYSVRNPASDVKAWELIDKRMRSMDRGLDEEEEI